MTARRRCASKQRPLPRPLRTLEPPPKLPPVHVPRRRRQLRKQPRIAPAPLLKRGRTIVGIIAGAAAIEAIEETTVEAIEGATAITTTITIIITTTIIEVNSGRSFSRVIADYLVH